MSALSKLLLLLKHVGWVNFYTLYVVVFLLAGLVGGGIIAAVDSIAYLDGFFLAASALTCTGLATVPMSSLSIGSFVVIALLIFFGQSFMAMNVYPCCGRVLRSRQISLHETNALKAKTIELAACVMVSYVILWHFVGVLVLIGALRLGPHHNELAARNYTVDAHALFLAITAFGNAGFTLSSDSIYQMKDNPLAYCTVATLVMAGCTLAPSMLRQYIILLRWAKMRLLGATHWEVYEYDELLRRGEDYSAYLFPRSSSHFLLGVNMAVNAAQFLLFCFSELQRSDALNAYSAHGSSVARLVGMGAFQTISTRFAGFQIMDLRLVSQGMLVVYGICMYLPPTPFLEVFVHPKVFRAAHEPAPAHNPASASASAQAPGPAIFALGGEEDNEMQSSIDSADLGPRQRVSVQPPTADGAVTTSRCLAAAATAISMTRRYSDPGICSPNTPPKMSEARGSERGLLPVAERARISEKRHKHALRASSSGRYALAVEYPLYPSPLGPALDAGAGRSEGYLHLAAQGLKNHDAWLLACLVVLSFTEDGLMSASPDVCNVYFVLFEILSAYGNVGLSVGVPGRPYSLSGEFSKAGVVVVIFIMYLGKHRGMHEPFSHPVDFILTDYPVTEAAERDEAGGAADGDDCARTRESGQQVFGD